MPALAVMLLNRRTFVLLHLMGTWHLHLRHPCLGARRRANASLVAMTNHRSDALDWQQHCQEPNNEKPAPGLHDSREIKRLRDTQIRHAAYITELTLDFHLSSGMASSNGPRFAAGQWLQAQTAEIGDRRPAIARLLGASAYREPTPSGIRFTRLR